MQDSFLIESKRSSTPSTPPSDSVCILFPCGPGGLPAAAPEDIGGDPGNPQFCLNAATMAAMPDQITGASNYFLDCSLRLHTMFSRSLIWSGFLCGADGCWWYSNNLKCICCSDHLAPEIHTRRKLLLVKSNLSVTVCQSARLGWTRWEDTGSRWRNKMTLWQIRDALKGLRPTWGFSHGFKGIDVRGASQV